MHHVTWFEARSLLHAHGASAPAGSESVPLTQAIGRVLSTEVRSLLPVPHYDSSAMDGYAVCGSAPWALIPAPAAEAGENRHRKTVSLVPGTASPVLTGGLLPGGTDAVLRAEHARRTETDGQITLEPLPHFFTGVPGGQPTPGADIRRAGEELAAGTPVLPAGTRLGARHIGSLATLGFDTLPMATRPTVALAYTGNEIITSGLPEPGEVRDAFSPQFPHIIEGFGAQVTSATRLPDSPEEFRAWFTETRADILVLTGGSSTSDVDWVRRTLAELGATYLYESVAIRPGHPALAALLPGGQLVLGLPGNPLAAHVALYSYLPAYLTGHFGLPLPPLGTGRLTDGVPGYSKQDLRLVPVTLETTLDGTLLTPRSKTRSHMLTGFASADALALIPAEGTETGKTCHFLTLE